MWWALATTTARRLRLPRSAQGAPNADNTYTSGGYPAGLLWPYIEQNPKTFKCPNGIDPATGQGVSVQLRHELRQRRAEWEKSLVPDERQWNIEHFDRLGPRQDARLSRLNHAATATNPRGPWPVPDTTVPKTHYPDQRHTNVFNVLYCDGARSRYDRGRLERTRSGAISRLRNDADISVGL